MSQLRAIALSKQYRELLRYNKILFFLHLYLTWGVLQSAGCYFTVKIKHMFVIMSPEHLKPEDGPWNMSCHVKYSVRITKYKEGIFSYVHMSIKHIENIKKIT